jgi:hypothetical protein
VARPGGLRTRVHSRSSLSTRARRASLAMGVKVIFLQVALLYLEFWRGSS